MDFEFETIRGAKFGKEELPADGRKFIDCTFEGTTLIFNGEAPFYIHGQGAPIIIFAGHAETTLNQLAIMWRFGAAHIVEQFFNAVRNPSDSTLQ